VVWRIPSSIADRDENKAFQLQTECLNDIPMYHTRVKKAMFLSTTVHPSFIDSKAAACAMYTYLTGDNLPRERCRGKDNAIQVAEIALATQDFEIIQDLRELNGRPKDKSFDVFWSEIKSLLESHARVDDRRHGKFIAYAYMQMHTVTFSCCFLAGDACFLPVAMSVRDLREQVLQRLNQRHPGGLDAAGIKIPTENWIAYQFSPKHPLHAASLHYTGALQIKHKVQARTLRANHPDSHYVASFFKMMKRLGIVAAQVIAKYTDDEDDTAPVVFFSMDDKAKISVGEPHLAVSFGGRGRCSILPTDAKAIACDHDFKTVSYAKRDIAC
jgi:hypothetical protein